MTGMGYPSTWKDALDKNGERMPKRDRTGKVIHNADGTVRYKQEPDGQGIIDWIEEQKKWIQNEMERRYGWKREYKGSHPRGNLSTPDYQAAQAKERTQEIQQVLEDEIKNYSKRIYGITDTLHTEVDDLLDNGRVLDIINRYMRICPDKTYTKIREEAIVYFEKLPAKEERKVFESLRKKIADADTRATQKQSARIQHEEILRD